MTGKFGGEGLDISEEQFLQLRTREQNVILYRNLKDIRSCVGLTNQRTKFQIKLQWVWLSVLTLAFGFGKFLKII